MENILPINYHQIISEEEKALGIAFANRKLDNLMEKLLEISSKRKIGSCASTMLSEPTTANIAKSSVSFQQQPETDMILQLIETKPLQYIGVLPTRLPIIKNVICPTTNVLLIDSYLTLRKLRLNEDFILLANYFQMSEAKAQEVFTRSVCRLARYLKFLISWPENQSYYDRHKILPISFRGESSKIQSLIECVETEMQYIPQLDCKSYKYVFAISSTGVITYISNAFAGHNDDLTIFHVSNFHSSIPNYLSLFVDPAKGVQQDFKKHPKPGTSQDSNTYSADESMHEVDVYNVNEQGLTTIVTPTINNYTAARPSMSGKLAARQTLNVVEDVLVSRRVKGISVPTTRIRDPVCRLQINEAVSRLREFQILQPYAITEPIIYQFINEILIVSAAITNLNY